MLGVELPVGILAALRYAEIASEKNSTLVFPLPIDLIKGFL
jgi:hypothetical protein